jgi:hypothetical protein
MTRHARLVAIGIALSLSATAALAQEAGTPAAGTLATGAPAAVPMKTIGQTSATGIVPSLAVINASSAKLEGTTLTLTGVAPSTIVFADRPVRAAGHVATEQFVMQWDPDKQSFAADPPNATISVLGGDGSKVGDAVVTLKAAKLDGGDLIFDVAVLGGNLGGASGPAALFIDPFAAHFGGFHAGGFGGGDFRGGDVRGGDFSGFHGGEVGGFHGTAVGWHGNYWHAPVYHGGWYGVGAGAAGAAVGLAAGTAIGAAAAAPYYYGAYPQCGYYPYPPCY